MRPGQAAPVFGSLRGSCCCCRSSFNEAGAGCPGIRKIRRRGRSSCYGFNEAGAGCPGIQRGDGFLGLLAGASMRPGQAAPVFFQEGNCQGLQGRCFNEAGAGCPGIPRFPYADTFLNSGFNEAGAGCPGIRVRRSVLRVGRAASMRPGQAAPVFP